MTTHPKQPNKGLLRLNKILARYGFCSRRKADEWILAGRVSVDGIVCRELGVQADPEHQRIAVDGKPLENLPPACYILLNKPVGVVTTRNDPQGRRTVLDLLPQEFVEAGVFPVGRLDYDSEGLLLLTNDGDWGQILLHPRHQIWKEYRVRVDKPLTLEQKKKLEQGVELDGSKTLPARIALLHSKEVNPDIKDAEPIGGTRFTISIREGRNRQIRRMCSAAGLTVVSLKRIKMGPIHLGKLETGGWRLLRNDEVKSVFLIEEKKTASNSAT